LQAKRELAKKEGRLLTKKQKEERARAEIQRQALLASGVQIEGLQQPSGNDAPTRKVVYGTRKKKGPAGKDPPQVESVPTSSVLQTAPEATPEAENKPLEAEVKDEWDTSSADGAAKLQDGVEDDWNAPSEDEAGEAEGAKNATLPENKKQGTSASSSIIPDSVFDQIMVTPPTRPSKAFLLHRAPRNRLQINQSAYPNP
jgi:translation initiation factor 5B